MSKGYDIAMIVLIIIYSLLLVAYFIVEDMIFSEDSLISEDGAKRADGIFITCEMVILGLFCIDIILHVVGYGFLYLQDGWNVFDISVIILNIIFVVLDLTVAEGIVKNFLKIRGIFRLLRISILFRKLNSVQ